MWFLAGLVPLLSTVSAASSFANGTTAKATLPSTSTTSSATSTSSCPDYLDCNRPGDPEVLGGDFNPFVYASWTDVASVCSASFEKSLSSWEATAPINTQSILYTMDGSTSAYHTEINVQYNSFFSYAFSAPCCLNCTLYGGNVQVYYWPTPAPTPGITALVNSANFTFTSPSVYVAFESLYATDLCGHVGQDIPATTIAFAPGALSTAMAYQYNGTGPDELALGNNFTAASFGNEQLVCTNITESFQIDNNDGSTYPYSGLPSSVIASCESAWTTGDDEPCNFDAYSITYNPCSPTLSVPSQLFTLNAEWKGCIQGIDAFFDPPYTLTQGNGLSAFSPHADPPPKPTPQPVVTAPTVTPTTTRAPDPSPPPKPSPSVDPSVLTHPSQAQDPTASLGTSHSPNPSPSVDPPVSTHPSQTQDPTASLDTSHSPKPSPSVEPPLSQNPTTVHNPAPSQDPDPSPKSSPPADPSPTQNSSPVQNSTPPQDPPPTQSASPADPKAPAASPATSTRPIPFVVGTQTINPGSAAVTIAGTAYSVPSQGGSVVVGGSTTVAIPQDPSTPTTPVPFIVGTQTVTPGSAPVVVAGTTYSVPPSGGAVVIDGTSTQAIQPASDPTPTYVLSSQTLTVGGAITIASSIVVSLMSGGQSVVVKGSSTTETLAITAMFTSTEGVLPTTGLGGVIISVGGFATPSTSSTGGGGGSGNFTGLTFLGHGSRVGATGLRLWISIAGAGIAMLGILAL